MKAIIFFSVLILVFFLHFHIVSSPVKTCLYRKRAEGNLHVMCWSVEIQDNQNWSFYEPIGESIEKELLEAAK